MVQRALEPMAGWGCNAKMTGRSRRGATVHSAAMPEARRGKKACMVSAMVSSSPCCLVSSLVA